jgi:hypothetical protein
MIVYPTVYPGLSFQKFAFTFDHRESLKLITKEFHRSSILSFDTQSITDWTGLTKAQLDQKVRESAVGFSSIKHCVYSSPYFIFQATYGEKPSDFYLFSLNTKSGDLVKIHKGYHRRFWVEGERFIFQHTDHFFACPLGMWNQLIEIQDPVVNLDIKTIYYSLESELPKELRTIDWENIHCVMQGSFKNYNKKELLMISGRIPSYKITLFSWSNQKMNFVDQVIVGRGREFGELLSNEESERTENKMVNFRQAVFEDIDRDQRLEILINGVYAAWMYPSDPLTYIDFSQPKSKKVFQLNKIQDLGDPEIIRYQDRILFYGDWSDPTHNSGRDAVFNINYSYYSGLVSLQQIAPIPREMKEYIFQVSNARYHESYNFGPQPKHLSFASTARNLSDAGKPNVLKSKKFPKLTICPLYNALNPKLTSDDKIYHTKRNELLMQYVKKLDTGWNPIPGFSFDGYGKDFLPDEKTAIKKLKAIVDVIPIFIKNEIFSVVVLNFQENTNNLEDDIDLSFFFLFDVNFKLLDYQSFDTDYPMHGSADIFLPLPKENSIFYVYGVLRGSILKSLTIEDKHLKETLKIYNQGFDFLTINHHLLLHITINDHYLSASFGDGGNGVGFYFDYFIDPATRQIEDLLLPGYFQRKLDYLYQMYHFFSYCQYPQESFVDLGTNNSRSDDTLSEVTYFIEQYEKNIVYHELKIQSLNDLQ